MDIYFNPYPEPAGSMEEGLEHAVGAADALIRLNNIFKTDAVSDCNGSISSFVLACTEHRQYCMQEVFSRAEKQNKDKLILLLQTFSKGKIIDTANQSSIDLEGWTASVADTATHVLEHAVKNGAVALTIATSRGWNIDRITFNDQDALLHNLWGQNDLTSLKDHYINSLESSRDRFTVRYDAIYCGTALDDAPGDNFWETYDFFSRMDRAKKRNYTVDNDLIKDVGSTKYGRLYELRCYDSGWRIFFVSRNADKVKILVAGFYRKGSTDQNIAIQEAVARVNNMQI